MNDVLFVKSVT